MMQVTEKLLEAIGVKKCSDILENIDTVFGVFPKMSSDFFLQAAMGLAHKRVKKYFYFYFIIVLLFHFILFLIILFNYFI